MKKIILLLCFCMILLTACGGGDKPAENTKPADNTPAAAEETKEEVAEEPAENANLTEFHFFKAEIPEGWVVNEEEKSESDYTSEIAFDNADGERMANVRVYLEEDPGDFRVKALRNGFTFDDLRNKAISTGWEIGDAYGFEGFDSFFGSDSVTINARDEKRNSDILLNFPGTELSEDAKKFTESFTLTTEDVGHVDFPYPDEGVKFEPVTAAQTIGAYNISADYLPFDKPFWTYDVFDVMGVQAGEYFYVLNRNNLHIYTMGETLTKVKVVDLGDEYDVLQVGTNGKVFVTDFMQPMKIFVGQDEVAEVDVEDKTAISADGTWGVTFFSGMDDLEMVTIAEDNTVTKAPLTFVGANGEPKQKMLREVFIVGDKIAVAGDTVDGIGHVVTLYDKTGKELLTLLDDEGGSLGSITGLIEGANGYLASDGNMRDFYAWDKAGSFLGDVDSEDLFGANYPWFGSFTKGVDGNYYVTMTQERDDESANDVMVFRVNTDI